MIRANFLVVAALALALAACGSDTPQARLAAAKAHLAKDDTSAAVIELKTALQQNPKLAEARLLLGTALLKMNDPAGAEAELRRALEYGSAANDVTAPMARTMVLQAKYKEVLQHYGDTKLEDASAQASLATSLGEAHMGLGQLAEAQREFDKAIALAPGHVLALLGSAKVKAMGGDTTASLALIQSALKTNPKSLAAQLFEGDILVLSRRPDDALVAYRKALEIQPKSLNANLGVVSILIDKNKLDEAGKQLDVVKQFAPKRPQTQLMVAIYELRRNNLAAAREAVQQFLVRNGDNLRGLMVAAQIEFQANAHAQAEEHLMRVIARVPNATAARRMLIQNYVRAGKYDEAVAALRPLLTASGADPTVLALAGETYLAKGEVAKAEPLFKKGSELDPSNQRNLTGLALTHLAQGRVDDAFRELERASEVDSGIRADMTLFQAAMQKRDYPRALATVDKMEKKQPKHAAPPNMRGIVYLAMRDFANARKSFEKSIALDPGYFSATLNLARLDLIENKPDDAKKRFDALLAKNPNDAQAIIALAELQRRNNDSPQNIAATINKAIAANPRHIGARLALVDLYLRSKEFTRAVTAAQQALTANPDRPDLLDALGRAQIAAGAGTQAVDTFAKWTQVQPKAPLAHLRLAEAQIVNKDDATAERSLRRALELKPDYLDAQRRSIALDAKNNRIPQALATAKKVQAQRPKESAGFILEGDIHAAQKAWVPAIVAYRAGLAQADSDDLAIRLHASLRANKQVADADKFAAARLRADPKDTTFRNYLAEYALSASEYPVAIEHYQALVAQQPTNATWLNNLAWAASKSKDPKALDYAEQADRARPNDPAIMDTLGVLLVEKGDTARGIETLRKAVKLAANRPDIRLNLAKGLIAAGQKDAARKELDELAKRKFVGQPEAEKLLRELGS